MVAASASLGADLGVHFLPAELFCGVQLVYALFGEIRNKYKKEGGKEGRFMYAHYGGKLAGLVYALYDAKSEARRLV